LNESMKYHIEVSSVAEEEIKEVCRWISRDSPTHAAKWRHRLYETIRSLAQHPARCGMALEDADFKQEIRELLYGKRRGVYRILFTIENDVVTILHVRHGARQPLNPDN